MVGGKFGQDIGHPRPVLRREGVGEAFGGGDQGGRDGFAVD